MADRHKTVLIAIGNSYRHDDGVGPVVGEQVAALGRDDIEVVTDIGDGTRAVEAWDGAMRAILVDSTVSGREPGHICSYDGLRDEIPEHLFRACSTHCFGVTTSIALGRALGRLPRQLTVYGIEGQDFSMGPGLSPAVVESARRVTEEILRTIGPQSR
ncbi:MAG: hydrogenase maturation protease [candidate division Zixibacteria bacterium]|jgi:hydrogenase maturation protease|nr:hydrogenase maturation protease [candidate division Zixibacteria bacterium]